TILLIAFWLVPLVGNLDWLGGLPWKNENENGYPFVRLIRMLLSGDLFDGPYRFPWLTILVLFGLARAAVRLRTSLARWGVILFIVSFALLMGRTNWGSAYGVVPLHGELEVIRYLVGVQFCGVLLAALCVAEWCERALSWRPSASNRVAIVLGVVATAVHLGAAWDWNRTVLRTFSDGDSDYEELVDQLRARRTQGRFLCHRQLGTARHFELNLAGALAEAPHLLSYGRGYHDTLSLYYLENFSFRDSELSLYNVGTVVVSRDLAGTVRIPGAMKRIFANSTYEIFAADRSPGYFDVIRTPFEIEGDPKRLRGLVQTLAASMYEVRVLPRLVREPSTTAERTLGLAADGNPIWRLGDQATLSADVARLLRATADGYRDRPIRSRVIEERFSANEYTARVSMGSSPDERLMLKVSYHPYWSATIDGAQREIAHLAPNLMALAVPEGEHTVAFRFRTPPYQKVLLLCSLLCVLGCLVAGWARMSRGFKLAPTARATSRGCDRG
ncbi:hypothetical protein ACFL59_06865, partial [Planctomycetota bacterium]